jgi:hypothetical protein
MRCEDWPERLDRLLTAGAVRPFEWGKWDCCLFVADALLAIIGRDLAEGLREKYSSLREARWLLRALWIGLHREVGGAHVLARRS